MAETTATSGDGVRHHGPFSRSTHASPRGARAIASAAGARAIASVHGVRSIASVHGVRSIAVARAVRSIAAAGAAAALLAAVPLPAASQAPPECCVVGRVIDGDTFVCRDGERVRLLLVDTPEMDREPYGRLARQVLLEMIPPGTRVGLETDVERRDVYDRLLAHVHSDSGTWVNLELARRGYAQVVVIPPNVVHVEEIRAAARRAREEEAGFWDEDLLESAGARAGDDSAARRVPDAGAADGADQPGAGRTAGVPYTGVREGSCHPSYPGVCLPPPPPDLDCDQIPARRFRVVGEDPHRLDGDGNGVACEGT